LFLLEGARQSPRNPPTPKKEDVARRRPTLARAIITLGAETSFPGSVADQACRVVPSEEKKCTFVQRPG
jgi:hypothetical protein